MPNTRYKITNNTWSATDHMHWYFLLAHTYLKSYRQDTMVGRESWLNQMRDCHERARECLRAMKTVT